MPSKPKTQPKPKTKPEPKPRPAVVARFVEVTPGPDGALLTLVAVSTHGQVSFQVETRWLTLDRLAVLRGRPYNASRGPHAFCGPGPAMLWADEHDSDGQPIAGSEQRSSDEAAQAMFDLLVTEGSAAVLDRLVLLAAENYG